MTELFPPIPIFACADSTETVHRFEQIVSKIRLDQAPPRNHWWHVPFHLTGRGIMSRPVGRDMMFAIDFDFVDHRLVINTLAGQTATFLLPGLSVAAFQERLFTALSHLGIQVHIEAEPYDLADSTPFAEDTTHAAYDPYCVNRCWQVLSQVGLVLEECTTSGTPSTSRSCDSPADRRSSRTPSTR
ncbi:hypothetical protein GCM10027280_52060 [Micromonospora polyrhachis]|uniref:Uncharacterized protein n=1 Tax=Micromonospora polyrhachis TaxID=1282883 RepID=A0A7W7SLU2_9ACTN|nr:DUF5996 family protein [Micromonospora polyrhachis]MBB4957172.1 hypothetical protein [Micromonospora polyrhachis]